MTTMFVGYQTLYNAYPSLGSRGNPSLVPTIVTPAMAQTSGTSCCVQLSHPLNVAGFSIPAQSYRPRSNIQLNVNGQTFYYLQAVDELHEFLRATFGDYGENVTWDSTNNVHRFHNDVRNYLVGRTGIMVFRDPGQIRTHTEIWDGFDILQSDYMDAGWIDQQFGRTVWFYDTMDSGI